MSSSGSREECPERDGRPEFLFTHDCYGVVQGPKPNHLCMDGITDIPLFATMESTQLPLFISPCLDNSAGGFDAFSMSWIYWTSIYLMPPLNSLDQVVTHLMEYCETGIMVDPYWPLMDGCPLLCLTCQRVVLPLQRSVTLSQMTRWGLVIFNNAQNWNPHAWIP